MTQTRRSLVMLVLVIAGEGVFLLPFVLARIFRPTFLDTFGLTNFELGSAFSLYGIIAMASYFAGGPLADRFSARRLMTAALFATAIGGAVIAGIPSLTTLTLIYGFWGLTTVLLFWAALIRATREWGGSDQQGRAFGILDGGRGLFSAILAAVMVAVFASALTDELGNASLDERTSAMKNIIWVFTALTASAGILVWLVVPDKLVETASERSEKLTIDGIKVAMRLKTVWLQAIIVVCAYVAYKSTDDFSLLGRDAFGFDDAKSARLGTVSFWMRPIAAMSAGWLADRIGGSIAAMISFGIMIAGALGLSFGMLVPSMGLALVLLVAGTSVGIYAIRGIYFALFDEAGVPLAVTGSAVGLVSVIGYTPDIFMGPLMGYLIDASPGAAGHQHVFLVVAGFALVGLLATILFRAWGSPPAAADLTVTEG